MVSSLLITNRCALRLPPSLPPLFWPDEDWSRKLNCRPPSPVLKPASFSARCNCGASCCSIASVSGFSTVRCEVIWPLRSTSMRTSMRPSRAGAAGRGRVEPDLEAALAVLDLRCDFDRQPADRNAVARGGRGQRRGAGRIHAGGKLLRDIADDLRA